jgi:hypothetical protein
MTIALRRQLQGHQRRAAMLGVVVLLGATVWSAHLSPADHHMGKAMAMCLAVAAVATAAVAALPTLGRLLPSVARPARVVVARRTSRIRPTPVAGRARGHPAVLQVFRR